MMIWVERMVLLMRVCGGGRVDKVIDSIFFVFFNSLDFGYNTLRQTSAENNLSETS